MWGTKPVSLNKIKPSGEETVKVWQSLLLGKGGVRGPHSLPGSQEEVTSKLAGLGIS